jgi:hypothetical protein
MIESHMTATYRSDQSNFGGTSARALLTRSFTLLEQLGAPAREAKTIRFCQGDPLILARSRPAGKNRSRAAARNPRAYIRRPIWPGPEKVRRQKFWASYLPMHSAASPQCVAASLNVTQTDGMTDLHQDFSKRPDDMIHVRLPADLRAAIERQAAQEHRTVSGQIRFLIAIGIEARSQPQHA